MKNLNCFKVLLKSKIIIFLFILITLSGCAGFEEKLEPDQAKWSLAHGDKTIIVRGVAININKDNMEADTYANIKISDNIYLCGIQSRNAILMPDTPYFRNWIHIIRTTNRFHAQPSKEAKVFIRQAYWQKVCVFKFDNVPAGKWLLILDVWHYLSPVSAGGLTSWMTSTADLVYVPFVVGAEEKVINKNIILDFNKRKDIGFFTRRRAINPAEINDWYNPSQLENLSINRVSP